MKKRRGLAASKTTQEVTSPERDGSSARMDGNINGLAPWPGKGCRIKNTSSFSAEIDVTYP
jgi:hypothetical protein